MAISVETLQPIFCPTTCAERVAVGYFAPGIERGFALNKDHKFCVIGKSVSHQFPKNQTASWANNRPAQAKFARRFQKFHGFFSGDGGNRNSNPNADIMSGCLTKILINNVGALSIFLHRLPFIDQNVGESMLYTNPLGAPAWPSC